MFISHSLSPFITYIGQDLAYYESPPGIQLLHCHRFDASIQVLHFLWRLAHGVWRMAYGVWRMAYVFMVYGGWRMCYDLRHTPPRPPLRRLGSAQVLLLADDFVFVAHGAATRKSQARMFEASRILDCMTDQGGATTFVDAFAAAEALRAADPQAFRTLSQVTPDSNPDPRAGEPWLKPNPPNPRPRTLT